MQRRPPRSTLLPYTTLFRSPTREEALAGLLPLAWIERAMVDTVPAGHPGAGRRVRPGAQQLASSVLSDLTRHLADRKSTRLNSSHANISYAVFFLKK